MNYRHAYHAGNHADVLKHIIITLIIEHLKLKAAPFRIYDAHAGIGTYKLSGIEAEKTLEWRDGVGRLFDAHGAPVRLSAQSEALIAPWRSAVSAVNAAGSMEYYPGSPDLAQLLIRTDDKLRLNELHPVDYEILRERFARDRRAGIFQLDALTFIKSQLPPVEKRGLVIIDPPYEKTDEATKAIRMLIEGLRRFATGIFCLWYPITGDGIDDYLDDEAVALDRPILTSRLYVRAVRRDGGLAGSGMIIVNPPWGLEEKLGTLLPDLTERLSQGDPSFSNRQTH